MKRKPLWLALIIFSILVTIPYLVAFFNAGNNYVFGGYLLNPQDGNSYLAKMEEGWRGDWKFTLPFSAEKSEGAYLFLFYIFLGHVARLTGISLVLVFHLTRVLCVLFMVFTLYHFTQWLFKENPENAGKAFLLCLFGSGLGWLFLLFGLVTSDLWVAETYPFLSAFASPHFSLGIGILLWIFIDLAGQPSFLRLIRLAFWGLLLAIVMPFGVVVAGSIGFLWTVSEWFSTKKIEIRPLISAFILGGPFVLYQYLASQRDPLLSIWNVQNITQSPPVWDLTIALLPALIFAVLGLLSVLRTSAWNQSNRLLVIWVVVGAALIYFPFSLQRQFMFSYFVPVGCLAIVGIQSLLSQPRKFFENLFPLVFSLSIISNGFVILLAIFGIIQKSPVFYLTKDEVLAFDYLKTAGPEEVLVLCAPETGNFIPGWTGDRVIYGHIFETVYADKSKLEVTGIYSGRIATGEVKDYLLQQQVKYVFWGPREKKLGPAEFLSLLKPVYQNGSVEIYSW